MLTGRGQKPSNKEVLAAIASIKKCRQGSFFKPSANKPCSCGWHTRAAARKQARRAQSDASTSSTPTVAVLSSNAPAIGESQIGFLHFLHLFHCAPIVQSLVAYLPFLLLHSGSGEPSCTLPGLRSFSSVPILLLLPASLHPPLALLSPLLTPVPVQLLLPALLLRSVSPKLLCKAFLHILSLCSY